MRWPFFVVWNPWHVGHLRLEGPNVLALGHRSQSRTATVCQIGARNSTWPIKKGIAWKSLIKWIGLRTPTNGLALKMCCFGHVTVLLFLLDGSLSADSSGDAEIGMGDDSSSMATMIFPVAFWKAQDLILKTCPTGWAKAQFQTLRPAMHDFF